MCNFPHEKSHSWSRAHVTGNGVEDPESSFSLSCHLLGESKMAPHHIVLVCTQPAKEEYIIPARRADPGSKWPQGTQERGGDLTVSLLLRETHTATSSAWEK